MLSEMGAAAYARMGVESDVLSANPHRLISLLFEGADKYIRLAQTHMKAGRMAQKREAISHALDIVSNGLGAALDMERGGELAERLASIYDYVAERLLSANMNNDPAALEEARKILGDIGSAWREIQSRAGQVRDETGE